MGNVTPLETLQNILDSDQYEDIKTIIYSKYGYTEDLQMDDMCKVDAQENVEPEPVPCPDDEYILVDRLYVLEKYKSYRTLQKHTTIALDNMAKEGYNKQMTELIVLSGKARKEYYLIQAEDQGPEAAAEAPMSQEEVDALMDVDPTKLSLEELNSLIDQTADKLGVDPKDLE